MNKFPTACLALSLTACALSLPPTRYYTLTAGDITGVLPAAQAVARYRVAVGPVSVPDVLDRPQLVLRAGPNRYVINDEARWAEPLKTEIPRVLAATLARQLPDAWVAANTQHMGRNADFHVLVDLRRLESTPGQSVLVEAAWSITGPDVDERRQARELIVEPVAGDGIDALVAAQGRALETLGVKIAAGFAGLVPPAD